MSVTEIRQKLHNFLELAEDKKVRAIYIMMEDEVEESCFEYSDEFKQELDRRTEEYKNGTEKLISATESKNRIEKLLKSRRKI